MSRINFGTIEDQIKEFEERIYRDGLDFCSELYEEAEIMLMAAKYAYHVSNKPIVSNEKYDLMEQAWYVMGRALGDLDEDENSPCVGWDSGQRSARAARDLAHRMIEAKYE